MDHYKTTIVHQVTGLTIRTLRYWSETHLFVPSLSENQKGNYRFYSFRDIVALRTLAAMRRAGISTQSLRKASERLKEYGGSFKDTYIMTYGNDVMMVNGEEVMSVLQKPGQMMSYCFIFEVEHIALEVEAALKAA